LRTPLDKVDPQIGIEGTTPPIKVRHLLPHMQGDPRQFVQYELLVTTTHGTEGREKLILVEIRAIPLPNTSHSAGVVKLKCYASS